MRFLLLRRPSASMVVAIIALIVAASGTAIAATQLVTGDSLIKRNSLSGNRLRNHSVAGGQINFRSLGKVPTARNADHASVAQSSANAVNAQDAQFATNAKNAANAASAFNASNADNLGGQPPSAFDASSSFVRTGLVTTTGGRTVPLGSFGPFSLVLRCSSGGAAEIDAISTEANSVAFGNAMSAAGTAYPILTTGVALDSEQSGMFITPSGKTYAGVAMVGINFPGISNPCVANALISRS